MVNHFEEEVQTHWTGIIIGVALNTTLEKDIVSGNIRNTMVNSPTPHQAKNKTLITESLPPKTINQDLQRTLRLASLPQRFKHLFSNYYLNEPGHGFQGKF